MPNAQGLRQESLLTVTALTSALGAVAPGRDADEIAVSIVSAATLIQAAVQAGMAGDDLSEVLSTCRTVPGLSQALDRAVSVALLDTGATVSLWLHPVVLDEGRTESIIPLAGGNHELKAAAYLQAQLALPEGGWVKVMPELCSARQVRDLAIDELIGIPHRVRESIRCGTKMLSMRDVASSESTPDSSLYFLPMVVYRPYGEGASAPALSDRVTHRITKWVSESLPGVAPAVAGYPSVFSEGVQAGLTFHLLTSVRRWVTQICETSELSPNALSALVAPYVDQHGRPAMGLTLASRLANHVVATLAVPVSGMSAPDPGRLAQLLARVLRNIGITLVSVELSPISTITCQHCERLQFNAPAPVLTAPSTVWH